MDELSPAELKAIGKRIAATKHRIKNPQKEGREAWSEEELAGLNARLAELEASRGGEHKPVIPGWERDEKAKPAPKAGPGDVLAGKKGYMAAVTRATGQPAPTIERLLKHAEKFGTDQVAECAAELGYGHDALERLIDGLDRIEAAAYRKDHPKAPPMKFPDVGKRVAAILGPREAMAA